MTARKMWTHINTAKALMTAADYGEAICACAKVVDLSLALGSYEGGVFGHRTAAEAHLALGEHALAMEAIKTAATCHQRYADRTEDYPSHARDGAEILALAGDIDMARGNTASAIVAYKEARKIYGAASSTAASAEMSRRIGSALAASGDVMSAIAQYGKALTGSTSHHAQEAEGDTYALLGDAYAVVGGDAASRYKKAIDCYLCAYADCTAKIAAVKKILDTLDKVG